MADEPRIKRSPLYAMMRVSHRFDWYKTQKELVMPTVDPNAVILTGENPFIRLSATDGGPNTTEASFWRITFSPGGSGHVLYLKSELTDNQLRIYADNIAMARWLQSTVQGMLNAATADLSIPVIDAVFSKSGDTRDYWTEQLQAGPDHIALTWYNIGAPLLVHTQPHDPPERRYGVCTILMPALGARLTVNGRQASGHAWPREREGRPFSTCALAFSESWTEAR
jgi:hypothetical protein